MKNLDWYHNLRKSNLTPPDYIFAPAWGILYLLMGVSLFLVLKGGNLSAKIYPITIFTVQLLLNFLWSPIFFRLKKIKLALILLFILWFLVLLTIVAFAKFSKLAAILMIPYFLWTGFATYLNFEIARLNR